MNRGRYIQAHFVSQAPGNSIDEGYLLAKVVERVVPAQAEYAKIGGASLITILGTGGMGNVLVTESVDDIMAAIEAADKEERELS